MSARGLPPVRVVRTRRGISLVQGHDVLSHTLAVPGPTHGFFDVLAASVVACLPEPASRVQAPRIALLGFAAGGVVAPLRAMGCTTRLDAVDLDLGAAALFRELSSDWAGDVRVQKAEAGAWLRGRATRYDVILEDLTVPGPQGATKPPVSLETLPQLLPQVLAPAGVAVVNVLPVRGYTWEELLQHLAGDMRGARVVHCEEYVNRILVTGTTLPSARALAAAIRTPLRRIRSRQQSKITVESLRAG